MKTEQLAAEVISVLRRRKLTLATAESCTGGGVGYALTSIPGSSSVYLGGVVSYANAVKEQILRVSASVLKEHGAVSCQTAEAMAIGAKQLLGADIAISITGIAGPASDDTAKPVGLVYVGVATASGVNICENHFCGDREAVRQQSIDKALALILQTVSAVDN